MEKIQGLIAAKVREINLVCALEDYKVDMSGLVVDNVMILYKEAVDKYKKYEIRELINTYFNKNQLADILTNKGYPMLISKLPNLLNGNIKYSHGIYRIYNKCNSLMDYFPSIQRIIC